MSDLNANPFAITVDAAEAELVAKREFVAASIVRSLSDIEKIKHADGWDQPPRLYRYVRKMLKPEQAAAFGGHDGFVIEAREIGDGLFAGLDGPSIQAALGVLASDIAQMGDPAPDDVTLAWMLINEAYMLTEAEASRDELLAAQRNYGTVHAHPLRIELRILLAIDTTGAAYQLIRRRDTDERTVWVDAPLQDDGGPRNAGGFVDSLRALVEATP